MTFISLDQPRIFLVSALVGVVVGVAYEPFFFLSLFFKNKFVKHAIKATWLALSSLVFIWASVVFSLPSFRLYMALSVFIGLWFYKNSFHKVFAIFISRVYNKINLLKNKALKALKDKYDRRKEKASIVGGAVGFDNANHRFGDDSNLSAHRHNLAQKRDSKVRCGNRRFANSNRRNGKRDRVVGA